MTAPTTFARCTRPGCTAVVAIVLTEGGRRIPVDQQPHPAGTVRLVSLPDGAIRARILGGSDLPALPGQVVYRRHEKTCPVRPSQARPAAGGGPPCYRCRGATDAALQAREPHQYHPCCIPAHLLAARLPGRPLDRARAALAAEQPPPAPPAPDQLPGIDSRRSTW